ncbi:MAG: hypothetical protein KH304_20530 [Clostridium sp.]|uniref:hypothetical protein n=1 Tax=Clostridia TaxID=186801 RepID=UPI00067F4938|nr:MULTISPECIES: hypothetical protein [Clostridia]MBS6765943.1 hypothetical protein [Clostridium sp.]
MKNKRSDKEKKRDRQDHYAGLIKMSVEAMARWHFRRRPYTDGKLSEQARRLIRVQGRQIERKTELEYLSGVINIKEGVRDNAKCKANE